MCGCDAGSLLRYIADYGAHAVGVDAGARVLAVAAHTAPQAYLLTGDAQTVDYGKTGLEPFDCVISRCGVMFSPIR